ncbi:MAG: four helix bundle protein [Cyclobacteriaceae bacterium]
MSNKNPLRFKSYQFAIRIIQQHQFIKKNHQEYDLSRQLLRSGTAIGALIRESEFGQSKADFISKLSISLKEANETDYWLNLLKDTNYISQESFSELIDECEQLIKMLVSSIKTAKSKL